MNRINPVHIGILLLVILMFAFFKLGGAKVDYSEQKESYKETMQLANELSGLKKVYSAKVQSKKSIQKILRHSYLRSAEISKNIKKSHIIIASKSIDIKALNFLMGKLLNGTYQISSMKIKRLSDAKVSFDMEIKW